MFFRRKPAEPPRESSARADNTSHPREHFRSKPMNAHQVVVRLLMAGGVVIEGSLNDLTMGGAGVCIPFQCDPRFEQGTMVEVHLEHPADGWSVRTPARIVHTRKFDDLHVLYGLEFVNIGNLYAQMDDAWAHYFSRRSERHFTMDLDAPMHARLRQRYHRMDANVNDISRSGISLRVPHHMAVNFELYKPAHVLFDAWSLPGEYELDVTIVNWQGLGEWDYLGLKIDEQQPKLGEAALDILHAYVDERLRAVMAREQELRDALAS